MKLRIGDRVRIVAPGDFHGKTGIIYDIDAAPPWWNPWEKRGHSWSSDAIGNYGVHPKETAYLVDVDGKGKRCSPFSSDVWGFPAYWLRPLDDPKADAFIERIKKLAREPNVAPISSPVTNSSEEK